MLPTKRVLSRLLASLYDAAANPDLWEVFLGDFAKLSRGNSAALMMHDFRDNRHNVAEQFGLDHDVLRMTYTSQSELHDVWAERAQPISRSGWMGVSEQLAGECELLESAFYNECLKKLDIAHGLFAVIEQSGPILANVSLYRSVRGDTFGTSELELLQFFMPHLRRAFQLHLRLTDLQGRSASIEAAADALAVGMVLLGATGKILFANRAANGILAQRDGLMVVRDHLQAQRAEESATLGELIRTATGTVVGNGSSCGGAILVSRKSRSSLRGTVAPLRDSKVAKLAAATGIAFILDPDARTRPPNEILSALFGLTPAECRIALLVSDGKSLPEISGILGVSRNTLKTQIASIYSKTGTSRQSQLVRVLLQLP